jgi:membrane-associated phospholipid phosphatase
MGTGPLPARTTRPATTQVARVTPVTRPWVRGGALAAYVVALIAWTELVGMPKGTVPVFCWVWLGTVAWHVEAPPRQHLDFLLDWWPPLAALLVYFYSRGLADDLGFAVHFSMPIEADAWLGGGTTPTQRLQDAWCGDPCSASSPPRWYDVALTTVYTSHFVTGLGVAAVLWVCNRVEWVRWMRRYLAISFAALVVYVAYPMAPPWMAAEEGHLSGGVQRLTGRGWSDLGTGNLDLALRGVGNPVAAMPSLHAGMAFLVALYAVQRWRSRWRWLLLTYPVAMSLALVYFGEHYVVDVAAGAVLAGAVLLGTRLWETGRGS